MSRKGKGEDKDKELRQSSMTHDQRHRIGKWKNHKETSHTREPRDQPFQAGDHKAARNRHDSIIMTSVKYK